MGPRLDDKYIGAAHILGDFHADFAIAEGRDQSPAKGNFQTITDLLGQIGVAVSGEYLQTIRGHSKTLLAVNEICPG